MLNFFEWLLEFFLKLFYGISFDGSYAIVIPGIVVMVLFAVIQGVLCFLKKCPVVVKLLPVVVASFFLLLQNCILLTFSDSWETLTDVMLAFPAFGMIVGEYLAWIVYGIVRLIVFFVKKARGAKKQTSSRPESSIASNGIGTET